MLARDADEIEDALAGYGGSMIVQRRVEGEVVSFGGVLAGGRLLGEAFSRYRRTWHAEAGNVCHSWTEDAPASLRGRVIALLEDLGWEGLFELELIETAEGPDWYAIDMNPRPYGSMALAIGAGANLPAIWWSTSWASIRKRSRPDRAWRTGGRMQHSATACFGCKRGIGAALDVLRFRPV